MHLYHIGTLGIALLISSACSHKPKVTEKVHSPETPKVTKAQTQQQVAATKPKALEDQVVKCLVGKDERLIRLDKETKRCEVHYTKFGEESQAAWAEATPKICSEVFDRIRSNIEDKGFKCQVAGEKTAISKAEVVPEKRETATAKK